jgi:hypothetical protein
VLYSIFIVSKSASCIVWRINIYTLNPAGELLLKGFERKKVVAEDQAIIEKVIVCNSLLGVMRLGRILNQDARLKLWPVVLANPVEFELLFFGHGMICPTEDSSE